MTNIVFDYNPILTKTKITINDDEIAKTCNLYRYRNTPLEDWIEVLIPELVEYCNDDELTMEIHSVRKYIDDVRDQINSYEKKHRHVEINVSENLSVGYKGRLNQLSQIEEEWSDKNQNKDPETDLEVLVVSMADEENYKEMLDTLFNLENISSDKGYLMGDMGADEPEFTTLGTQVSEIADRYVKVKMYIFPNLLECPNRYWRILKEKINGEKDYILITLLNSDPKKNDELYEYIADPLSQRGKRNRSRFIFIADDVDDHKEYISDEYGIRSVMVLESDRADESLKMIKQYIQNVSYIRKIIGWSRDLKTHLEIIKTEVEKEAERRKDVKLIATAREWYKNQLKQAKSYYQSMILQNRTNLHISTEDFIDSLADHLMRWIVDEKKLKEITYSVCYELSGEIMSKTEKELFIYLIRFCQEKYSLHADQAVPIIWKGVSPDYQIGYLVREIIAKKCSAFVQKVSLIEKRPEYGSAMEFFAWVIENITEYELWHYMYSFAYVKKEGDRYGASEYEIRKKIRRRFKTIEDRIENFLNSTSKEVRVLLNTVLEQKMTQISNRIQRSEYKVEAKLTELESSIEISDGDKIAIAAIEETIKKLDRIMEL